MLYHIENEINYKHLQISFTSRRGKKFTKIDRGATMIITEVKIPISLASKKREKQFPYSSCNPPKSLLSRTNSPNSVLSVPSSSKFRSRENAHARSSRNRILLPRLPLPRDGFRRISLSLSLSRGGGEEYPGAGDLHAAAQIGIFLRRDKRNRAQKNPGLVPSARCLPVRTRLTGRTSRIGLARTPRALSLHHRP